MLPRKDYNSEINWKNTMSSTKINEPSQILLRLRFPEFRPGEIIILSRRKILCFGHSSPISGISPVTLTRTKIYSPSHKRNFGNTNKKHCLAYLSKGYYILWAKYHSLLSDPIFTIILKAKRERVPLTNLLTPVPNVKWLKEQSRPVHSGILVS